jgi:hypothetical protein
LTLYKIQPVQDYLVTDLPNLKLPKMWSNITYIYWVSIWLVILLEEKSIFKLYLYSERHHVLMW